MSATFQISDTVDWPRAVQQLWELEAAAEISLDVWNEVVHWLLHSAFDGKAYIAGETAASLLLDRAPAEILNRFLATDASTLWGIHFQNIAGQGKVDPATPRRLELAVASSNLVAKTFALSLQRFQVPAATLIH